MRLVFSIAILANAALIFWVELFFAKRLLPTLGGAPAIWNTCLMFYQGMLLAGYAYALVLVRLDLHRQLLVHGSLLLLTVIGLPWLLFVWPDPGGAAPIPWLLALLTLSLGAPFLLLAAGATLLQRWFSLSGHPDRDDPYFLYSASNAGSFLALAAYPLVLEPTLTLDGQALGWKTGFAAVALLLIGVGVWAWRSGEGGGQGSRSPAPKSNPGADAAPALTPLRRLRWVGLTFLPSSLLLGVTTHITSEIAPVPLLWVVPLALYLLTFVVAFGPARNREEWGVRPGMGALIAIVLVSGAVWFWARGGMGLPDSRWFLVAADLAVLTVAGLVCLGRVAKDRPTPGRLAEFYFWIALGGAMGGVFNTLVAPVLFTDPLEYPLALALLAFVVASGKREGEDGFRWSDLGLGLLPGLLVFGLSGIGRGMGIDPIWLLIGAGGLTLALAGRPVRFGLAVGGLVLVGFANPAVEGEVIYRDRTFFGIHRVYADGDTRWLAHGTTIHGGQRLSAPEVPLTYYHPRGPAGSLFAWMEGREMGSVVHVGVVGLGTGSLMAYSRHGELWTLYELDPEVAAIAEDERLFTFLSAAPAAYRIVLGDARLSLGESLAPRFDLLIVDAFSSDAIPVHLLTIEAVQLYLSKLRPGGIVAFHISNRYADFTGVMGDLGHALELEAWEARDEFGDQEGGAYPSHWAVLAPGPVTLPDARWRRAEPSGRRPWTDSHSSLLPVLRW